MTLHRRAARHLSTRAARSAPPSLAQLASEIDRVTDVAPASAASVPASVRHDPVILKGDKDGGSPGAAIRAIGTSRRVLLLNDTLSPTEIDGLAFRLKRLASSDALNSVLVANPLEASEKNGDMSQNRTCLPSFMDHDESDDQSPFGNMFNPAIKNILQENWGQGLGVPSFHQGYDARKIYEDGLHNNPQRLELELMNPLMELTRATRGSYDDSTSSPSKVPLIAFPNGLVSDSGYAFLMGSYVLACQNSNFRILNPLRGLAFDPVGLSFTLPRIGQDFQQASKDYATGCAFILALMGFEAGPEDLVSTGLATHYVGGPYKLNHLEHALSELDSHSAQKLRPLPKHLYNQEKNTKLDNVNKHYKNVAVGNLIQAVSEYDAAGRDEYGVYLHEMLDDSGLYVKDIDPSVTMPEERIQMYGNLQSDLVNWAATFSDVFAEDSVEGMLDRLQSVASTKAEMEGRSGDAGEDVRVAEQAQILATSMKQRSPLALRVMFELMKRGRVHTETIESCMEREKASQMRLMSKKDGDFERWAGSGKGVGMTEMRRTGSLRRKKDDLFTNWNHSCVSAVTEDEVLEIVGAE